MVIANSSGCSSVWGGSYGLSPFKKNRHGQGLHTVLGVDVSCLGFVKGRDVCSLMVHSVDYLLVNGLNVPYIVGLILSHVTRQFLGVYGDCDRTGRRHCAVH